MNMGNFGFKYVKVSIKLGKFFELGKFSLWTFYCICRYLPIFTKFTDFYYFYGTL